MVSDIPQAVRISLEFKILVNYL